MIDKYSTISLTYTLRGESLRTRGVYTTATLSKEANERYTKTDGETMMIKSIETPSKTIKEPEFAIVTQHVTLSAAFMEGAMERPKKPHHRASLNEWNLYQKWGKMADATKLNIIVGQYVEDLGGTDYDWELL